jgi:hypothetical protein
VPFAEEWRAERDRMKQPLPTTQIKGWRELHRAGVR